jgi:hypothetical protein
MSQPKTQLQTFKSWAGKSSDISYYLNSHHIDIHEWAVQPFARAVRVSALGATGIAKKEIGVDAEDTITVCAQWENFHSGTKGVAVYTSSWASTKTDVHSVSLSCVSFSLPSRHFHLSLLHAWFRSSPWSLRMRIYVGILGFLTQTSRTGSMIGSLTQTSRTGSIVCMNSNFFLSMDSRSLTLIIYILVHTRTYTQGATIFLHGYPFQLCLYAFSLCLTFHLTLYKYIRCQTSPLAHRPRVIRAAHVVFCVRCAHCVVPCMVVITVCVHLLRCVAYAYMVDTCGGHSSVRVACSLALSPFFFSSLFLSLHRPRGSVPHRPGAPRHAPVIHTRSRRTYTCTGTQRALLVVVLVVALVVE